MGDLPNWVNWSGAEVVHLDPRRGLTGRTPCCNLPRHEVPYRDRITIHPEEVTCELNRGTPPLNSIVDREAALSKRAGEALSRLLQVRGWLDKASPDQIDAEFRNQLLKLIDWGQG